MFPRDSTELQPGSICLVIADPGSLERVVTSYLEQYRSIHVLYCGGLGLSKADARFLRDASGRLTVLDRSKSPAEFQVHNLYEPSHADSSDHVRLALERLHQQTPLDRIEFSVQGGLAFRTVQAKVAGLAFLDVQLVARLDSCSAWVRQQEQRWPGSFAEVEIDFAERFSYENADIRVEPCSALTEFVRSLDWVVRSDPLLSVPDAMLAPDKPYPLVTVGIAYYNLGQYLPETLASLATQTYPNTEVIVIDDGSTDPASVQVFAEMEVAYPHYRFFHQMNAGIGATRNRCIELATGEYFIPVDADNIARPEMVWRFVEAMQRNPRLVAMTCYYLAFAGGSQLARKEFLYAGRPTGGPHVLASVRNIYGDANAIFCTRPFRALGGYTTDRGTSCEDWEAFVRLVNAGHRIGVVPAHLFYYRHLVAGFSRRTNWFANHQRPLRQFTQLPGLPPGEGAVLWTALLGFHLRIEQLTSGPRLLRYRIADALHGVFMRLPWVGRLLKQAVLAPGKVLSRFASWMRKSGGNAVDQSSARVVGPV